MSWINPKTWETGELVTADDMNSIRDNLLELWKGTANGDMEYFTSSTAKQKLSIGQNGSKLTTIGGIPVWRVGTGFSGTIPTTSVSSGTLTDLSITVEDFDSDSFHQSSNNYITLPFTGLYGITLYGYFASGTDNTLRGLYIRNVSTNSVILGQTQKSTSSEAHLCVSGNIYVNTAGVTIKFTAHHTSTGALNFYAGRVVIVKL